MAIDTKTRKKLWAKSGNRCAFCKIELFTKEDATTSLNIGEECHIISSKKNGPRYKQGLSNYDAYDNLLLLCRNHHKEIDTLIEAFPEEVLRFTKMNHENWVKQTLEASISKNVESEARFLIRMTSGKDVFDIISDVYGYRVDYDEADNNSENEYIAGVLQTLADYADLCSMGTIEQFDKVKIASQLKELLLALEKKGYFLFAERNTENIQYEGMELKNCEVATLVLKENDNSEIIKVNLSEETKT